MGMLSVVKTIPKILKQGGGKVLFKLQKNKPQILLGAGVVLAVGGFVMAVVNARKMDAVMQEGEEEVALIEEKIEQAEDEEHASLKKDLRKAKTKNIVKMTFLMGVPCIIFASGIVLMIGGHVILFRRFSEVSTSLALLREAFEKYRQMNIAEHGEECDRRYRYGIIGETEAETTFIDQNGEEQKTVCKVPIIGGDKASLYSFEFSENFSRKCPRDPVSTISFLRSQEKYWNMWMGSTQKPVTLAMVLDGLGIELDPDDPANDYILIAGWRPNGDGDNKIDFGIMRATNKPAIDMIENVVMLNFNCDGNIYHSTRYTKDGRKVTCNG